MANVLTVNGVVGGAGTLIKNGAGTLVLGNAGNTYTGGTDIAGGILQVSADGDLGAANGAVNIRNGTTLQATANFATNAARGITLAGGAGALNTIDTMANVLTVNGVVGGAGTLIKNGAGTLVLGNAGNTYTGGTDIAGGILQVSADGDLGAANGAVNIRNGTTLQATANFATNAARGITLAGGAGALNTIDTMANVLTVNGVVGGAGTLIKNGAGTLVLGDGNTYTGGTDIAGGILQVSADGDLGAANGAVNIRNGTVLQATANFATNAARGITLAGGAGALNTIDTMANVLTVNGVVGGAGTLIKNGAGTLVLGNAGNTYTGGTDIAGGTLQVSADGDLGAANGAVNIRNGTTLQATANSATNAARGITLAGGAGALNTIDTMANVLTVNGVVGGAGTLIKNGAGTLVLGNAGNTYTGGTDIAGGTLQVSADGDLGAANGAVNIRNGTTLQATANFATNAARGITLAGGAGALNTIDTMANVLTVNGVVGGAGTLIKNGAGTLMLGTAGNTYTGGTEIAGGILQVSANGEQGAANGGVTFRNGTAVQRRRTSPTSGARLDTRRRRRALDTFDTKANMLTVNGVLAGPAP